MSVRREFLRNLLTAGTGLVIAPSWALAEIHRMDEFQITRELTGITSSRLEQVIRASMTYLDSKLERHTISWDFPPGGEDISIPVPVDATFIDAIWIHNKIGAALHVAVPHADVEEDNVLELDSHPGEISSIHCV